jgi:hypothetical protein
VQRHYLNITYISEYSDFRLVRKKDPCKRDLVGLKLSRGTRGDPQCVSKGSKNILEVCFLFLFERFLTRPKPINSSSSCYMWLLNHEKKADLSPIVPPIKGHL